MTDPIADFLTRIRNAVKANHKVVEAPGSKIKQEMTKILYEQANLIAGLPLEDPGAYTDMVAQLMQLSLIHISEPTRRS